MEFPAIKTLTVLAAEVRGKTREISQSGIDVVTALAVQDSFYGHLRALMIPLRAIQRP